MTYFTCDQHFGHYNIIRLCERPFDSLHEMDETMVERWNAKVGDGDTVYVLGDLFFRARNPLMVLSRLKGNKHLIVGNHDHTWMKNVNVREYFESVELMKEVCVDGVRLTLCHYPMMSYPNGRRGYMIYGHIHGNTNMEFWPLIRARTEMLNAGVEVNGYAPISLGEMIENNRRFKSEH